MQSFQLNRAVFELQSGGIVAHATEGVWGLCCDPFSVSAVAKLSRLKGRDLTKGFVVIGSSVDEFAPELELINHLPVSETIRASWPGATTWLLPNVQFPAWVTGESEQVAARVPGHAQSKELCAGFGGPLISTSANPSKFPAARNALQVNRYFHSAIRRKALFVLPGILGDSRGPSKIVDALAGNVVRS